MAHAVGVAGAETPALVLPALGVAMRPTALVLVLVLTVEVDKVEVGAIEAEVEDMVELNTTVMVEVELPVLLCPFSPLASEPPPPAPVF